MKNYFFSIIRFNAFQSEVKIFKGYIKYSKKKYFRKKDVLEKNDTCTFSPWQFIASAGVHWQEMLNDNGITPPMLDLFPFFWFAYVKWKIDDSGRAAERTYANEKHRRPPLGFRRRVESKETAVTSHTAGNQWFYWKTQPRCLTDRYCGYLFILFFSYASPHTEVHLFRNWFKMFWDTVRSNRIYLTQIRSNSYYHGNPPEETSWAICSSANFELVLPHLTPAAVIKETSVHSSSNILRKRASLEWDSEGCSCVIWEFQASMSYLLSSSSILLLYWGLQKVNLKKINVLLLLFVSWDPSSKS